jgi:hypothetical protein
MSLPVTFRQNEAEMAAKKCLRRPLTRREAAALSEQSERRTLKHFFGAGAEMPSGYVPPDRS